MEPKSSSESEEANSSRPRRTRSNFRRHFSNPDLSSPSEYYVPEQFTSTESQSGSSSRETSSVSSNNRPVFDPGFRSRDSFGTRPSFIESGRYPSSPSIATYSSSSTIWTPDKEYRFTPPFSVSSDLEDYAVPAVYPQWEVPRRKDEFTISSSASADSNLDLPSQKRKNLQYRINLNTPMKNLTSASFKTAESVSKSASKKKRTNMPIKSVTSEYKKVAKALIEYPTSNTTTVTESESSSRKTSTGLSSNKSVSLNLETESAPSTPVEPSAPDIKGALPRRSFCKRLRKQKKPWLEHIKLYAPLFLIVASLQVLSFIFIMLRLFSPIGDPVSFTINAGCLFVISFTFFRATIPEGPPFLASPIADDDSDEEERQ